MKLATLMGWAALLLLAGCTGSQTNLPSPAPKGFDVGSAGDAYAAEFVRIGYDVVGLLRQRPIPIVSDTQLLSALTTTRVVSFERLTLNGAPVDAINYASALPPRIEMSRERWDQLKLLPHEKVFLVLHEYLGILGIDDKAFQVSHQLDQAHLCTRSDGVRRAIEKHFQRPCYEILTPHLAFIERLDVSGQKLTSLRPGDFDYLYELRWLDLSWNRIASLPPGIFRDLGKVIEISLKGNLLSTLPRGAFTGLSSLWTLGSRSPANKAFQFDGALWENPLRHLEGGFLDGLTGLTDQISLCPHEYTPSAEIRIEQIDDGAFAGLTSLDELELCFDFTSPTSHAPSAKALAGLERVHWLRLSGTGLDRFPPRFFSTLTQTTSLWLTSEGELRPDQIEEIDQLKGLQYLILKNLHHNWRLERYLETERKIAQIAARLSHFTCRPYSERGGEDRDGMACYSR